ncbi:hypothetical protein SLA_3772 [Streptomyces laurentii]|uniref:Uncharacterized protein n=1 Tax=Streptomyces laurentii TaxID=39478 RepID=A0A160P043_STRLU|nr:hypothetical protein SLA_3772 [Streptomyces laurentii]
MPAASLTTHVCASTPSGEESSGPQRVTVEDGLAGGALARDARAGDGRAGTGARGRARDRGTPERREYGSGGHGSRMYWLGCGRHALRDGRRGGLRRRAGRRHDRHQDGDRDHESERQRAQRRRSHAPVPHTTAHLFTGMLSR